MIDWMVEVLCTFKCSNQSFFLAIQILDTFFEKCQRSLLKSDLHLTGIVSMMIATKYEDVIPLLMKTIVHKIGHDKFKQYEVENREREIL